MLFPVQALGEESKVADIKKGQRAPFNGVLMSNDVATKLYLDSKFSPKECEIKVEEKVKGSQIDCERSTKLLESKLSINTDKFQSIIELKNNRIDFLEKRWSPAPWYESGEFWFSMGIISGILITIASGYAIGQAAR